MKVQGASPCLALDLHRGFFILFSIFIVIFFVLKNKTCFQALADQDQVCDYLFFSPPGGPNH